MCKTALLGAGNDVLCHVMFWCRLIFSEHTHTRTKTEILLVSREIMLTV